MRARTARGCLFAVVGLLLCSGIFYARWRSSGVGEWLILQRPSTVIVPAQSGSNQGKDGANKDVVIYVYAQSKTGAEHLKFFLRHALHDRADFIFVFNGADPKTRNLVPDKPNIRVIERENRCYDYGTHGVVLRDPDVQAKAYRRFILMNASVKGPFMPGWSRSCWSDAFFDRLTDKVKLVGTTVNCLPRYHLQSQILAFDHVGIGLVLQKLRCFETLEDTIYDGEVYLTERILEAGYSIDSLTWAYHGIWEDNSPGCGHSDFWLPKAYYGAQVDPFEVIFPKGNRRINVRQLDLYAQWMDATNYSSYDYC